MGAVGPWAGDPLRCAVPGRAQVVVAAAGARGDELARVARARRAGAAEMVKQLVKQLVKKISRVWSDR